MTAVPTGNPLYSARDPATDLPLVGGKLFTYLAGTTTLATTWADKGKVGANTNPIILDANGQAEIYGDNLYRFYQERADGTLVSDVDGVSLGSGGASANSIVSGQVTYSADHTIIPAEMGMAIIANRPTAITFSMPAAATAGVNGYFIAKNDGAGLLTLDPNLAETIDGKLTQPVYTGSAALVISDGTKWNSYFLAIPLVSTNVGGSLTALASAATVDLGSVFSNLISITGNAAITSFGSSATLAAPLYEVTFTGAAVLTYNATSMILPGGANIVAAAGDSLLALYLGSGNWQVIGYNRAAPAPNVGAGYSGGFRNLVMTATAATVATVTADGATLFDANGNPAYVNAVSVTNTNSGNGANGLDTGAMATSTWYYMFLIYNPTTQTVASLVSLSATAPTLPSGYTFKLRVGALRNAATLGYWRTIQRGRETVIQVGTNPAVSAEVIGPLGTFSGTSPTLASQSMAAFVPPTANAIKVSANNYQTANVDLIVATSAAYSGTNNGPSGTNKMVAQIWQQGTAPITQTTWLSFEATQNLFIAGATGFAIAVHGWEDNL